MRKLKLQEPSEIELANWIRYYKRKAIGQTHLPYADLEAWCIKRLNVPDDIHAPFVIGYEINVNEDDPKKSTVHVSISTRLLLEHGLYTKHVCTYATYKLMWHGFPVFSIGVTDMRRKFHPTSLSICCGEETSDYEFIFRVLKEIMNKLFNILYEPYILVADGAHAITNAFVNIFNNQNIIRIMCWVHMYRNVDKNLNGSELKLFKDDILNDITILQRCISSQHFQYACDLFFKKWQIINNDSLNAFL